MLAILMSPWFIGFNLFFSIVPPIYTNRKVQFLRGTPELNKQYHSFYRYDLPNWDLFTGIIWNIISLWPLRFIVSLL